MRLLPRKICQITIELLSILYPVHIYFGLMMVILSPEPWTVSLDHSVRPSYHRQIMEYSMALWPEYIS